MTRIYLAAQYSRHEEMLGYAEQLRARGHTVTSRWIKGEHEDPKDDPEISAKYAMEDVEDMEAAEALVFFSNDDKKSRGRGGRHVEFGIALATEMDIAIIGPRENVFHHLPFVAHFDTWEEFLEQV